MLTLANCATKALAPATNMKSINEEESDYIKPKIEAKRLAVTDSPAGHFASRLMFNASFVQMVRNEHYMPAPRRYK